MKRTKAKKSCFGPCWLLAALWAACTARPGDETIPFYGAAHPERSASSLHLAAWKGHAELVGRLLDDGARADAEDELRLTPLHWAGDARVAQLLIERGADLRARDVHGWTPLHTAAMLGRAEVAGELLRAGANVNASSINGMTPLHWAALQGQQETVRLLLAGGADVRARDARQLTPLHEAADGGIAKLLIEAGAEIDARDEYGLTPLHLARHSSIATELIQAGAAIQLRDRFGRTPLEMSPPLPGTVSSLPVTLVASDSLLRLPHGSGELLLIFRNASLETLLEVKLAPVGEIPLQVKIQPPLVERCSPGDRCVFALSARRTPDTPAARFSLEVVLSSRGREELYRAPVLADPTPESARRESGWLQAGTIRVTGSSRRGRLAALALLCALPLLGLLGWGFYLKKKARGA